MKKFLPTSKKGFTTFSSHKRGFTLIELLVVITIIAVLSVVGFVVYSGISARARDTRRMAEIDAIQKAMEQGYRPGATNPYPALTNSDFVNTIIPTDPLSGTTKCGAGSTQVCEYCAFPAGTAFANYLSCSITACTVAQTSGKVSTSCPQAGKGYVVCANLETTSGFNGATYYCRSNAQ